MNPDGLDPNLAFDLNRVKAKVALDDRSEKTLADARKRIRELEKAIEIDPVPSDSPRRILARKKYVVPDGKRDRRRKGKAQRQARKANR